MKCHCGHDEEAHDFWAWDGFGERVGCIQCDCREFRPTTQQDMDIENGDQKLKEKMELL